MLLLRLDFGAVDLGSVGAPKVDNVIGAVGPLQSRVVA